MVRCVVYFSLFILAKGNEINVRSARHMHRMGIFSKSETRTRSTNLTQNDCILVEASSTQTESQSELQILLKNSFSTQAVDKLDTPLQKRAPKTGWNSLLL